MTSYSFSCFGHKNILAKHRNTIEFTKDKELTMEGDCIIGVNSDFELEKIKELILNKKTLKIKIKVNDLTEEIICNVNPGFDDSHEIVLRKSEFNSKRTLGFRLDKAAKDLSREMIEKMKNPHQKMIVELRCESN